MSILLVNGKRSLVSSKPVNDAVICEILLGDAGIMEG